MWGLEPSLAALINAVAGGAIGAAATLGVGLWSTRKIRAGLQENVDTLKIVARGLEGMARSGKLRYTRDAEGGFTGEAEFLSGTSPGGSSDRAAVSVEADLEDSPERNDERESKRDRPLGEAKDQ